MVSMFVRVTACFSITAATTSSARSGFAQIVEPQHHCERPTFACKSEICCRRSSMTYLMFVFLAHKIKHTHETFTADVFTETHEIAGSRILCLVDALVIVFRSRMLHPHKRMTCGSGVLFGVRQCASGECFKLICVFGQLHEIGTHRVYSGPSDTRTSCRPESMCVLCGRFV